MKKDVKHFLPILLGLSLGFVSCSQMELDIKEETPETTEEAVWTLKVEAGDKNDELTKALSMNDNGTIKSEWVENDAIIAYKYLDNGELYLASPVGTLTAEKSGAYTTFSGSLTSVEGLAAGTKIRLTYPNDNPDYRNQNGTLEYISDHCNFSYAEVEITELNTDTKVISTTGASFHNCQAIWKMTFQDADSQPVNVTSITLAADKLVQYYGGNIVYTGSLTITPTNPTNVIWVAVNTLGTENNYYLVKCVTEGSQNLVCTKHGNLQKGKYYTSTLRMEPLDANYITEIKTVQDLKNLSAEVSIGKNYAGQTVTLMNDLDFSGEENFTPIGVGSALPFAGFFDGNHKTISKLTISSTSDNVGLFGYLASNGSGVKDLTLDNCVIKSTGSTVGGVAGYSYGNITGCTVNGSITGTTNVAGIVSFSYSSSGLISNNTFSGTVTATNGNAGGIMNTTNHAISKCTNNGTIIATKCAGGIASGCGRDITNCTNTGNVTGGYAVGGIDGLCDGGATISGCVNNGNVTATGNANWEYSGGRGSYVGGIVGRVIHERYHSPIVNCINTGNVQGAHNFVGGIAGFCSVKCGWYDSTTYSDIIVNNCQNSGSVQSTKDDVGGIVGISMVGSKNSNIIISNCTNTGSVTGDNNVGGIEGRSAGTTNTYIDTHPEYTKSSFSLTGNINTGAVTANSNKGGIVGVESDKDRSTFTYTSNYFTQEAAVAGAVAGIDQDGAKGAYKIIAGTGVTVGLSTEEDLLYSGTKYYVSGKTVTMTLSGGTSYAATDVNSTAVALTDNGGGTFSLTMPAANVTVTAN